MVGGHGVQRSVRPESAQRDSAEQPNPHGNQPMTLYPADHDKLLETVAASEQPGRRPCLCANPTRIGQRLPDGFSWEWSVGQWLVASG